MSSGERGGWGACLTHASAEEVALVYSPLADVLAAACARAQRAALGVEDTNENSERPTVKAA